ncbi:hypothetical protein A2G96_10020 [Cupriavidus nantongensis]|uniref:Uncharacterized protein n=2 Tax=Cupriavidus nantongensis TaxID=1796606 RepID=A0A142JIZ0_9BURK|nr:hypothetical protein A2G96_10020 [Cupriavidus nantongensis]
MEALASDDFGTAKALLTEHKISPTVRDWTRSNMSPLAYAIRRNDAEFAAELIAGGADVNGFAFGDIPLIALANAECAEQLARAGADVNASIRRDSSALGLVQGASALIHAAHRNDGVLVAKLIVLGADTSAVDRFGRTALHYAARSNGEAAKELVAAGADLMAADQFGKTPSDYGLVAGVPARTSETRTRQHAAVRSALGAESPKEEDLLQALEGFQYAMGDKLSLDHGEFLYLDGKDSLGMNFAVVPRTIDLPVTRFCEEGELESYMADQQLVTRERDAVRAFFLISQLRDRQAHEQIVEPPENAIIGIPRTVSHGAIDLNEYISRIESSGSAAFGDGTQDGPDTLLRGRYVRDGAGQYRRLGEEHIALVDDGDKIRFADKEIDTFQAASELAEAKNWQGVQVTGAEEFRAKAWFAARLAGLDVQGYEPTNKDLDRLESAVGQALSSLLADPPSRDRTEAPPQEMNPKGDTLYQAPASGTFVGKVMALSADHLEQKVGRDPRNVVVHDRSVLSGDDVEVGHLVTVSYERGKGRLQNHDLAVEHRGVGR